MNQHLSYYVFPIPLLVRLAVVVCLFYGTPSFGMSGFPPEDMICQESYFPNPAWTYIKCNFPRNISKFTTTNAAADQKGALVLPKNPVSKLKLRAHFNGYSARPVECDNWDFSDPNYITTKNCPGHYPDIALYPGRPLDWGGVFNGELAYGWRIAALFKYAEDRYNSMIDWGAGITLQGCSYGGSTSMLQSLLMPDVWVKNLITVVDACVPPTLFVRISDPLGNYWRDIAVLNAWKGFDWREADMTTEATGRIYYRVNGSPADSGVVFDLDFFRLVCDAKRIPCFGTWHNAGHTILQPGVQLPFGQVYTAPGMSHRLDQPQIAFTKSSANWWGPIGFYNLGLAWHDVGMLSTKTSTTIPLRYLRSTNIGEGVPDQPATVTFTVTVRNTKMQMPPGKIVRWSLGLQSGTSKVKRRGELTIRGLELKSSEQYQNLTLK